MKMSNRCNWPKEDGRIFIEGNNPSRYSYYGWGDSSSKFYAYIEGYKNAADSSIDYAIKRIPNDIRDSLIYPVCFLYRQTLELQMKYIYLHFSADRKSDKIIFIKKANHNLMKIWNKVKLLLNEYSNTEKEIKDIAVVESYVNQFHHFDMNSFTFRYPITRDLSDVLDGQNKVDLLNIKSKMDELYNYFSAYIDKISTAYSYENEMKIEMEMEILSSL